MMLLITSETKTGGRVQLTHDQWRVLRPVVSRLRNGPPAVTEVEREAPEEDRPFRVWLDRRSLIALEQAAASLPD